MLSRADFLILCLGTWGYLLALMLGQGVMSLRRHRLQMVGWFAGIAVLAVVPYVLPGDALTRIEWAYAMGCLVVAASLGAVLLRRVGIELPRHDPDTAAAPPNR